MRSPGRFAISWQTYGIAQLVVKNYSGISAPGGFLVAKRWVCVTQSLSAITQGRGFDSKEHKMPKTAPGRALRKARVVSGVTLDYAAAYTQFKLGKSMSISREQLRKMESNMVEPEMWNAAALVALAELYGVAPSEIIPPEVNQAGLRFIADWVSRPSEQAILPYAHNAKVPGQTALFPKRVRSAA
jgi:DNA-binding XRE family transcriptional regulator